MNDLSWRARRAAARWLFCELRMQYVAEEISLGGRQADVVGYSQAKTDIMRPRPAEVRIIEVKTSRSDFMAGVRKGQISNDAQRGGLGAYADFCYVLVTDGVVPEFDALPARWGLLTYREFGNGARVVDVAFRPKRLTPERPLTVDGDRLREQLVQSTLWRLYHYRSKLTVTRDADTGPDGDWSKREIAT